MDYADTERQSRREGRELAGLFARDQLTRFAASGAEAVAEFGDSQQLDRLAAELQVTPGELLPEGAEA